MTRALAVAVCALVGVGLAFSPAQRPLALAQQRRRATARASANVDEEEKRRLAQFSSWPEAEPAPIDNLKEGVTRHPELVKATLETTAELLEGERPMVQQGSSWLGRLEQFAVGLVRHPVMVWGVVLTSLGMLEEELEDDAASVARDVRVAAEAVRDSRKI